MLLVGVHLCGPLQHTTQFVDFGRISQETVNKAARSKLTFLEHCLFDVSFFVSSCVCLVQYQSTSPMFCYDMVNNVVNNMVDK